MSIEDDLSADVIPCDRADSHAKHGSAIMLLAWRLAHPPRSCWKCELRDQLDVERSTFFQKSATAVASVIAFRSPRDCCHRFAIPSARAVRAVQLAAGP